MFSKSIKVLVALACMSFSVHALADAGFKVPVHYNVELVDGVTSPENYSRFNRTINLTPGRHQVVVSFKDTFGGSDDAMIVESTNPIVVDIMDLKPNQVLTFEYQIPSGLDQARRYSRQQKITLIDKETGKPVSKDVASYFILASETGFTLMRDFRTELLTLNRLYAPTYSANGNRTMGMTEYGSPIIEASAASNLIGATNLGNQTMDAPGLTTSQNSNMSTSSKGSGASGAVNLNQLIKLYNQADDATKLKFVKYVMSH